MSVLDQISGEYTAAAAISIIDSYRHVLMAVKKELQRENEALRDYCLKTKLIGAALEQISVYKSGGEKEERIQ